MTVAEALGIAGGMSRGDWVGSTGAVAVRSAFWVGVCEDSRRVEMKCHGPRAQISILTFLTGYNYSILSCYKHIRP